MFGWISIVLAHWNNSLLVDMSLHLDTISKFLADDQTEDLKFGACCFSAKHTTLRGKSKDWSARNLDIVSKWSDMSTNRLLFQWANTIEIQPNMLV
jgi:hypothetical protein